jgi:hypothetical protein
MREHGYDVAATDLATTFGEDDALRTDLTDYGQAVEALRGGLGHAFRQLSTPQRKPTLRRKKQPSPCGPRSPWH